jgi:hypothetical protein
MQKFPPEVTGSKDNKKHVKAYNKIGYTIFYYEYLWQEKWNLEVERAKAGL